MSGAMEITTKIGCSLNCRCCPQELFVRQYYKDNKERKTMMSFDDFKSCIDIMPSDVQIDFSGFVEPWLNPDCTRMVMYANELGRKITLFTTLIGMKDEDYEKIRGIRFENVVLHIPDQNGNSHFELTDEYLALVKRVIGDAMSESFRINKYSCHGPVHESIRDIVEKSGIFVDSNLHDRAGNVEQSDVTKLSHKGSITCSSGPELNRNVLMPDGTVVLCAMDFGMRYQLGNLLEQSYEEILGSPGLDKIRHCMKSEKNGECLCRNCVIAENAFEHAKRIARNVLEK